MKLINLVKDLEDEKIDESKLVWKTLNGSISFEREETCHWKQFFKSNKTSTLFSFVSFSPTEGLLLISKSKPLKFIRITNDDYNFGYNPTDLRPLSLGFWMNGLTAQDLDTKLSVAREDCGKPLGWFFYSFLVLIIPLKI